MATLQKIRSKGPLLIIVIGLALFAFIAGDAWKVIQPHQSQDVGEIDGETLSAQEYQALLEEYTEIIKFSSGMNSLTEEQNNQVKDEVWQSYVNNKLVENEAKKIGLTVTNAEIQSIIDAGVHPVLQQTPFRNPQTGRFDKDMLKMFLAEYARMKNSAQGMGQYQDYYESMNRFWLFIERTLLQSRLADKYYALISKSMSSNPVEAQANFDARVNQMDLQLAAIPYTSIPDSTIKVRESEVKEIYNKRKEQYRQLVETRNIKYIDVQVTASPEDRTALQNEVMEYTEQLAESRPDYTSFIRSTGSQTPYVDLYLTRTAYPTDIVARFDSTTVGEAYGPYYNVADNTINSFKIVSKANMADSIQYRQIEVATEDITRTKTLADSIYNALRGGANFEELAQKYNQTGETRWISSANYENMQVTADDLKYIKAINDLGVREMGNVNIGVANVIIQVTDKKVMTDKYKVAVIKRPIEFSRDTYNRAYNDFSQFIAANPTLEQVVANAEEAGYNLLERSDLYSSEHSIGGVAGSKDALRWLFSAKPGEVSTLYEAGSNNDRLLVVGLEKINKAGYRSLDDVKYQLRAEVVKDKKAEQIISNMKSANASAISQYASMNEAVSDTVKHVTFAAPAYVSALRSSEPLVSSYASVAPLNRVSAPTKGTAGVFVAEVYAKENLNETFDVQTEKDNISNMHQRFLNGYLRDLYQKADVKDARYLFF